MGQTTQYGTFRIKYNLSKIDTSLCYGFFREFRLISVCTWCAHLVECRVIVLPPLVDQEVPGQGGSGSENCCQNQIPKYKGIHETIRPCLSLGQKNPVPYTPANNLIATWCVVEELWFSKRTRGSETGSGSGIQSFDDQNLQELLQKKGHFFRKLKLIYPWASMKHV